MVQHYKERIQKRCNALRKLITDNEKAIEQGTKPVSKSYKRLVRYRVKKKREKEAAELLLRIEEYLKEGRIDPEERRKHRYDIGFDCHGKPDRKKSIRKGLPQKEKRDLKDRGLGELAKAFDGKDMIKIAGEFKSRDIKAKFAYELLTLIHKQLLENCGFPPNDKAVLTVSDKKIRVTKDFNHWWFHEVTQDGPYLTHVDGALACGITDRDQAIEVDKRLKEGPLQTLQTENKTKRFLIIPC